MSDDVVGLIVASPRFQEGLRPFFYGCSTTWAYLNCRFRYIYETTFFPGVDEIMQCPAMIY